jgi:hypothetical protein
MERCSLEEGEGDGAFLQGGGHEDSGPSTSVIHPRRPPWHPFAADQRELGGYRMTTSQPLAVASPGLQTTNEVALVRPCTTKRGGLDGVELGRRGCARSHRVFLISILGGGSHGLASATVRPFYRPI